MHFLSYYVGISKQTEVIIITLAGICCTLFDKSLVYLHSNLHKVWNLALDTECFSEFLQSCIKYILSGIILVRSFTIHLCLAFYIVMLWPAIYEERPILLLPWLLISMIKSLLMNSVALIVGMYICIHSHFYKSTCIDFLVSQLIDYAPSFYVWFCVMSYYHQLKTVTSLYTPPIIKYSVNSKEELAFRRRKVRSMTENSNIKYRIYLGDDSNLITESRIENLVQQSKIHLPKNSRSLDTLLTSTSVDSALLSIYEKNRVEVADRVLVDIPETLSKMIENETVDSIICHDFKVEKRFSTTFFKMNNLHDKFKMVDEDNKNIKITTNQNNVSDILRATESEKQTCPHSSKMHVVNKDALPEISEFEIRPVLNYSTTTMATPKEGLSLTNKVIEKKIHSFSRRLISPRLQHVHTYYVEASNQPEGFESGPPISSQNSNDFRIYTCDFTCQTSTLSRNVLKIAEKLSFSGFSSFQSNLQLLVNKFERHNIYPFKADGYTVEYYIQAEKNKSCSLLAKHV